MRAGRLNQRVILERLSEKEDAYGATVKEWDAVGTFWAAVEPLTGREIIAADAVTALSDIRVIMRFQPGITAADRLVHKDRPLEIKTVIDRRSRNRELELLCKAIQ